MKIHPQCVCACRENPLMWSKAIRWIISSSLAKWCCLRFYTGKMDKQINDQMTSVHYDSGSQPRYWDFLRDCKKRNGGTRGKVKGNSSGGEDVCAKFHGDQLRSWDISLKTTNVDLMVALKESAALRSFILGMESLLVGLIDLPLWSTLKYPHNHQMDCHEILYKLSWFCYPLTFQLYYC